MNSYTIVVMKIICAGRAFMKDLFERSDDAHGMGLVATTACQSDGWHHG